MDTLLASPRKVHPVIHKDHKGRQLRDTSIKWLEFKKYERNYISKNNFRPDFYQKYIIKKTPKGPKQTHVTAHKFSFQFDWSSNFAELGLSWI